MLTSATRRASIDYDELLELAHFRAEHAITESEHFAALLNLGVTKDEFARRIKSGQRANDKATPPSVSPPDVAPPDKLAAQPIPEKQPVKIEHSFWSRIVLCCSVMNGAIFGMLIRIGTSYFDPQLSDGIGIPIFYANILGCIVMGFIGSHEKYQHQSRSHHIVYVTITSGFCGGLTSYSTVHWEAAKLIFRQWDSMSTAAAHGNFLWLWLMYLWMSITIPLAALRLGQHVGSLSPCLRPAPENRRQHLLWLEAVLVLFFVLTVVVVVVVSLVQSPPRVWLAYAAGFGALGGLVRYELSTYLNPLFSRFPLGTFVCNILGTIIFMVVGLVAKFVVYPSDVGKLAVYYGLIWGLCGCITTMSSFVNEIHKLGRVSLRSMYAYSLSSMGLSQLIALLLYCLVSNAFIPSWLWDSPPHLDYCGAFNATCLHTLRMVGCPASAMVSVGCVAPSPSNPPLGLASFVGECRCGNFDIGSQVGENVAYSQIRSNRSETLVSIWPTVPLGTSPSLAYDVCASFDRACEDLLNRIGCPVEMQTRDACQGLSLGTYRGVCACGQMTIGSRVVGELGLDGMLGNRLSKWQRYPDSPPLDFCKSYDDLCQKLMTSMLCPEELQRFQGCQNSSDVRTFVGECACGPYVFSSERIAELIVDTQAKQLTLTTLKRFRNVSAPPEFRRPDSELPFDMCTSFDAACTDFLHRIACPLEDRIKHACGNTMLEWVGTCTCGMNSTIPGGRLMELLVGATMSSHLISYSSNLPFANPYRLLITSDPLDSFQAFTNVHYGKGYAPNLNETPWLANVAFPD